MSGPRVLVFDSGLGGLSVVRALREHAPALDLVYGADHAGFPYGDWGHNALVERLLAVVGAMIGKAMPQTVVIACNTATTVGLEHLRQAFPNIAFVGTVPAIKPAANATKTGNISVLATPGTIKREYTKALIDTYAYHCNVNLVGATHLAEMAEEWLTTGRIDLEGLRKEIAPAFVDDDNGRTDVVVLGCTHYPLLAQNIAKCAPWPVELIDPSAAIAAQTVKVTSTVQWSDFDLASDALICADGAIPFGIKAVLIDHGFSRPERIVY